MSEYDDYKFHMMSEMDSWIYDDDCIEEMLNAIEDYKECCEKLEIDYYDEEDDAYYRL